jgi:hypothetical protein
MTRPFRLVAPAFAEDDLHAAVANVLDRLLLPPATWTTFPAGNVELTGQAAAKLARLGLKRGWPDVLVLHGSLHGIELKNRDGKLSRTRTVRTRRGSLRLVEGQQETFPRLEAAGMKIAVCRSIDDVLLALRGWNVPMRGIAT